MALLADWQLTVFVVWVTVMAFAFLWFGRMVWRFLRGEIEAEAGVLSGGSSSGVTTARRRPKTC